MRFPRALNWVRLAATPMHHAPGASDRAPGVQLGGRSGPSGTPDAPGGVDAPPVAAKLAAGCAHSEGTREPHTTLVIEVTAEGAARLQAAYECGALEVALGRRIICAGPVDDEEDE